MKIIITLLLISLGMNIYFLIPMMDINHNVQKEEITSGMNDETQKNKIGNQIDQAVTMIANEPEKIEEKEKIQYIFNNIENGNQYYTDKHVEFSFSNIWTEDREYRSSILYTTTIANGDVHILFGVGGHGYPLNLKKELIKIDGVTISKFIDISDNKIINVYFSSDSGFDLEMMGDIKENDIKDFIKIVKSEKYYD